MMIDNAADLPIMLYNYPGRTGVNMGVDFLDQVSEKSNFQCIKEASGDINRLHLLVNEYSEIALSCGAEDQALEFFVWGATSWVTPMGNFIIKEVVNFYNTCTRDKDFDKARQMMQALLPLTSVIESGGKFAQSVKFAANYQGLPTGPVRPPMQEMTPEFESNLKAILVTAQTKLSNIIAS
jgi:4-hydroxy-tetrahydrodipicolinate synthase